jgi:acetaldehyde dehydrogenase (acetylating)
MKKVKVGIIGTGNIGMDLLYKINRSEILECGIFAGHNPNSEGIKKAKSMGINVSFDSINSIINNPDCCEIVFDATSAKVHMYNAPILKQLGKFAIDLTPSRIGKMCVPVVNLAECLDECNVNLITCGGQATIPIIYALKKVHPEIKYVEIVASIASKSAGPGTRANIDEFTQTTSEAICELANIEKSKAIIILNPAEPPILMHNTIYTLIKNPNIDAMVKEVLKIVEKIQEYVPGYKLLVEPIFENGRVTTIIQVTGIGDFLPSYSGNLDIITCAGVNLAEQYAKKKLLKES